jgi:molecular chaperone DnaK (HSP70)
MTDEHDYFLGIDLGTTNSAVAWGRVMRRTRMFEPEILEVEQIGPGRKSIRSRLLPSVVYFEESGPPIVGEFSRSDAMLTQPHRVIRSVKSRMGSGDNIQVGRQAYAPARISSFILNQLRAAVKDKHGADVNDAVITVPASFDADMRAETIEAARLAGIKVTNSDGSPRDILLDEPRAALYYLIYLQRIEEISTSVVDLSTPKNILIFDLGGGTLDVSLHKVQADYDAIDVDVEDIAISRYTRIGGDNFDELIADFFQKEFEKKYRLEVDAIPEEYIRYEIKGKMLLEAESKKRELNDIFKNGGNQGATIEQMRDVLTVKVHLPNLYDNKFYSREKLRWDDVEQIVSPLMGNNLTIDDVNRFDELTGDDASNIIYPILDVLHKAKTRMGSVPAIDAVFMNGGMTRFIPVQQRLEKFFGKKPFASLNPDYSVAMGASLYHYSLHQGLKPKSIILAETIGIEISGGYVKHLVPQGTVLPTPNPIPIQGLIIPEGTAQITIPFYRGEKKEPKSNEKLLERIVKLPYTCTQDEELSVDVSVDANKILTFRGRLVSAPEVEIEIKVQGTQSGIVESDTRPIEKPASYVVPINGERLDVNDTLARLLNSRATIESIIKNGIEKEILAASNRAEFISPLAIALQQAKPSEIINKKVVYRRSILILGALGAQHPEDPGVPAAFSSLCKICTNRIANSTDKNKKYLNEIVQMGVVALGRLKNPAAETLLLELLNSQDLGVGLKDAVIVSLAKISRSANSFSTIAKHICGNEIVLRKVSSWAIGKMGSRDSQPALPIKLIASPLVDLLFQVEKEQDSVTLQMMTYAISELADQRNPSRNEVIPAEKAKQALHALEKLKTRMEDRNKLKDADQALKKYIKMGIDMISGKQLAQEQEKVLLSLRSKLDESEKA